ncbi:hypothetical protein GUJ93_ZPchr0458g22790 [Zizania palustris]|uniref:AB hydrolase-1 domain-containing protein n=1 Tax=Zizania palustris TaxID=103762 RepID=A0A8J5VE26_ZIZPA|nr:hypothetical protein GUJ93_ZPchr0458g22790 [Zizania palustris]
MSCCPRATTSSPLSLPRSACRSRSIGGGGAFSSSSSSCGSANAAASRVRGGGGGRRRSGHLVVAASSSSDSKDETTEGKKQQEENQELNPFRFVTDNPSSRSAIQLPESPAEDGNVGQMLYRIEGKGRDYGSRVKSGKLRWFVRETGSADARRGTVVFIHGAPAQSFSYRMVMAQMADAGYHCFAPDWIGFGFSDMPQPGYGFNYTEEEFHESFDELLGTLNITEPFFLVVQVPGQNF